MVVGIRGTTKALENATLFLRVLARISGTKYDGEATDDARLRITSFFGQHLRDEAPEDE